MYRIILVAKALVAILYCHTAKYNSTVDQLLALIDRFTFGNYIFLQSRWSLTLVQNGSVSIWACCVTFDRSASHGVVTK